ncbi:MAG: hypothetical protein JW894_09675 [Bacteroidales bacterium]|nr:hypothetical protein [Bacteroidales bacterium]
MKTLNLIALISAGAGILLILAGIIQLFSGRFMPSIEIINYFHAANSLFLIAIVIFVHSIKEKSGKE